MNQIEKPIPSVRFKGYSDAWKTTKLQNIVDVRSGKDYKHLNQGDIPVYGTGGYMLSVDEALSYDTDAVGIGRKGTINKPYLLHAPFWTVDTLFYSIPKVNNDLNFIHGLFQRVNWKALDESTGVPSLSKQTINNVSVTIPCIEEQKKIGQLLVKLDKLIELNTTELSLLKEQKKGFLQKMFPQSGETVPKIRFEGYSDAWEQRKLGDMTESFNEQRIPIDSALRTKGKYPYYGATGIIDYVEDFIFDGEYVLLAEDGANITMRNSPIAYLTSGKFWLNNHAHIMKMKQGSNQFLLQILEKQNYIPYNTGTAQPKLNSAVVKNILLYFPSIAEQTKIGNFFKQLDDTIALHQRKVDILGDTKKALLQKMFI